MSLFNRWKAVSAKVLLINLANSVKSDFKKLKEHPFKRGNVWKKAAANLGGRFNSDKDAFMYFAAFHGTFSDIKKDFCKINKIEPAEVDLFINDGSYSAYCICGLLESDHDESHATVPMKQCNLCKDWFHCICLAISKPDSIKNWTCALCKGDDPSSFLLDIFKDLHSKRKDKAIAKTASGLNPPLESDGRKAEAKNLVKQTIKRGINYRKDSVLFEAALAKLKTELQTTNKWTDDSISNLALSVSFWRSLVETTSSVFKRGKQAINNELLRIYKLQGHHHHKNQLVEILKDCSVSEVVIDRYKFIWEECFGVTTHPREPRRPNKESITSVEECYSSIKPRSRKRKQDPLSKNAKNSKIDMNVEETNKAYSNSSECLGSFAADDHPFLILGTTDGPNYLPTKMEENEDDESNPSEALLNHQSICNVLGISTDELEYRPPAQFAISLKHDKLHQFYDFTKMQFKPYLYGNFINQAMQESCGIPCSFNSDTSPAYSSNGCRIYGYCAGDCEMQFTVKFKGYPAIGKDWEGTVTTDGVFILIQNKSTARKISGTKREEITKLLENGKKPYNLFVNSLHKIPPLQFLHNNLPLRSKDVMRKIKSETIQKTRTCAIPEDEIVFFAKKIAAEHNPLSKVKGYIQNCNLQEGSLSIHLYDLNSLQLHITLMKQNKVELRVDATGSICKNRSDKSIYLYMVLAVVENGISFPLGMMVTEKHNKVEIGHFLKRIRYDILTLAPELHLTCLGSTIVCDFSFAIINSILEGVNVETLIDYVTRSWKALNNEEVWQDSRSCIFICSSHLIKATQRNLSRKISVHCSNRRKILELALFACVRLIECESLLDFQMISEHVINVFGTSVLPKSIIDQSVNALKEKVSPIPFNVDSNPDDNDNLCKSFAIEDFQEDKQRYKPIRELSPFYSAFQEFKKGLSKRTYNEPGIENTYYCEPVLGYFEKHKIPLLPLWIAAIPKLAKNPAFEHRTNAAIESEFKNFKQCYLENNKLYYSDVTKELIKFYEGRRLEAMHKLARIGLKPSAKAPKKGTPAQEKNEKWQRKKSGTRKSKYFPLSATVPKTEGTPDLNEVFAQALSPPMSAGNSPSFADKILRLPGAIPWGGFFLDGPHKRKMENTCPFDSQFFIMYSLSKLATNANSFFQNADNQELMGFTFSFDLFLKIIDEKQFDQAKSFWLRHCNFSPFPFVLKKLNLHLRHELVDCWGSEEELFLHHIRPVFKISEFYTCSNQKCSNQKNAFPPFHTSFPSIDGRSAVQSVQTLTGTRYYRKCPSCSENVFGKFDWFNGIPLPFFPVHGNPGGVGPEGEYIVSSSEEDLKQYETIRFGGKDFKLYAYSVYSNRDSHYFGIFNSTPKIRYDGHDPNDEICQVNKPDGDVLAVSTLWYIQEDLITSW